MENDILKKTGYLNSKETKERRKIIIRVIYELRHKYPLVSLLKFTKMSKSSYFYEINTYGREDKGEAIKE